MPCSWQRQIKFLIQETLLCCRCTSGNLGVLFCVPLRYLQYSSFTSHFALNTNSANVVLEKKRNEWFKKTGWECCTGGTSWHCTRLSLLPNVSQQNRNGEPLPSLFTNLISVENIIRQGLIRPVFVISVGFWGNHDFTSLSRNYYSELFFLSIYLLYFNYTRQSSLNDAPCGR